LAFNVAFEERVGRHGPRLPDPMLSHASLCPPSLGWSHELKWDGFRAIVSTEDGLAIAWQGGCARRRPG